MNPVHFRPEQQPRVLLSTSVSVSNKESGKQIHLGLFLGFRSGIIEVSVLLRDKCPKFTDSVVVTSSRMEM
jgi:hypothetical protein